MRSFIYSYRIFQKHKIYVTSFINLLTLTKENHLLSSDDFHWHEIICFFSFESKFFTNRIHYFMTFVGVQYNLIAILCSKSFPDTPLDSELCSLPITPSVTSSFFFILVPFWRLQGTNFPSWMMITFKRRTKL